MWLKPMWRAHALLGAADAARQHRLAAQLDDALRADAAPAHVQRFDRRRERSGRKVPACSASRRTLAQHQQNSRFLKGTPLILGVDLGTTISPIAFLDYCVPKVVPNALCADCDGSPRIPYMDDTACGPLLCKRPALRPGRHAFQLERQGVQQLFAANPGSEMAADGQTRRAAPQRH